MDEHDDANLITPPGHMDQSMPLLVGLFESSASRRSLDAVHTHESQEAAGYNLEEIAAKRIAGGSIIDSIANMANSILGAGKLPYSIIFALFTHCCISGIIGNFPAFYSSSKSLTVVTSFKDCLTLLVRLVSFLDWCFLWYCVVLRIGLSD